MSNLVIVESPTKAKTLSRFLGPDYRLEASMGHIRDLPEKEFGIDIEHDFAPHYVMIGKKQDSLAQIKALAAKSDHIYLATDPDREGEAISWHIVEVLGADKKLKIDPAKYRRIVFHEITEPAIKEALVNPRGIDLKLVDAQQARRVLDRIVGYKLSPVLWRKIKKGLSAGRVQSVAVRLIAEREKEILGFVAKEYWEIYVELLREGSENGLFWAKLIEIGGKKADLHNKETAEPLVEILKGSPYKVKDVQTREVSKTPPASFTTSTLQQTAANRFGWSAKKTMQIAQNLYEEGLITYHRTDSTNLSDLAIKMVREFISRQYPGGYMPGAPRFYKTKSKVAQEAHEAIRPTEVSRASLGGQEEGRPAEKKFSRRDEERLYELIWRRFVACQMSPATFEETTVDIATTAQNTEYLFEAKGSKQVFDGWLTVYESGSKAEDTNGDEEPRGVLPPMAQGDSLTLKQVRPEQKFTQPPTRFTEASLIKRLEELGIGRPSTYAPILTTIQDRQYVEKVDPKTGLPPGRFLKPTSLGMTVNDFLLQHFPEEVDYDFTAHMEEDLDEVANGDKGWVGVVREFYEPFARKLDLAMEAQKSKVELEETGEICPECKVGKLVIRLGRFGKFISCDRFPDCKYRAPYVPKVEGLKCPSDGGDVVLRRTRKGKIFYGCFNWPKCKWASWTKPKASAEADVTKPE